MRGRHLPRLTRILPNAATAVSALLCVAATISWHRSFSPHGGGYGDAPGFDLVHWEGDEQGYLAYGLACCPDYGRLRLAWVRLRGGVATARAVAAARPVDDVESFVAAQNPARADDMMPGVGDRAADAGGPPGRWNVLPHFVWDLRVRGDDYLDTGPPLVETRWGLKLCVERVAWQSVERDGAYWQRVAVHRFEAPFWFVVALLALPAIARLVATVYHSTVRRSHAPGSCRACGYDLRATPARCPECGIMPAASLQAREISSGGGTGG